MNEILKRRGGEEERKETEEGKEESKPSNNVFSPDFQASVKRFLFFLMFL